MDEELLETIASFKHSLEEIEYFDQTEDLVDRTISKVEQILSSDDYSEGGGIGETILLSLVMFRHLVRQLDAIGEDIEQLDSE